MSLPEIFDRWHDFLKQRDVPDDILFLLQRTFSKFLIVKYLPNDTESAVILFDRPVPDTIK